MNTRIIKTWRNIAACLNISRRRIRAHSAELFEAKIIRKRRIRAGNHIVIADAERLVEWRLGKPAQRNS